MPKVGPGARDGRGPAAFGEVRQRPADDPGSAPAGSPPAGSPPRPPRTIIFLITVTGVMANTLIAPAIPDILADLRIGAGQAGLLVAAATLPGIFMAPVIGLASDRYGRREVVVPCLVTFGLAGGLAGLAPSFAFLLGLRLLQGVGSAGLINLAVVLIGDHWVGKERAKVIGQNAAVLTASLAVLPPLGGLLTDLGGWRATFLPYWLALASATAVWVVLPASVTRRDVAILDQVKEAGGFLRSSRVLSAMGTGAVVFVLIFGLFLTALPLHLERQFGLGATARGLVLGLPALTSTIAALSLGRLAARRGQRPLILGAMGLFAVAFAVIGLAPSLPLLLAGALLYGLGEGVTIPSLQDVVAGAAPASSRGSVMAVWVGGVRAGQTAGPVLAGALVAGAGAAATFLTGSAVVILLLVVLVATGQPRTDESGGETVAAPTGAPTG